MEANPRMYGMGDQLAGWRKGARLTRQRLSAKTGVAAQFIGEMERNVRPINVGNFVRITVACGLDSDERMLAWCRRAQRDIIEAERAILGEE